MWDSSLLRAVIAVVAGDGWGVPHGVSTVASVRVVGTPRPVFTRGGGGDMHRRVWRWRRLGYVCAQCGLGWRRGAMRCHGEPRAAGYEGAFRRQPFDWMNAPTAGYEIFRLTQGQAWRGNGGTP
jgi:hypothetical protein